MKKTIKTAALRQPFNCWISRRVYVDDAGKEFVKINGHWVSLDWIVLAGWELDIVF